MKKLLSVLAFAGIFGSALFGCVEDNPYVLLGGVTLAGQCSPTSTDQEYLAGITCDPSDGGAGYLSAQILNYITGASPWSGSGGGSGTTFQATPVNPGLIFLDTIIMSCKSVNGKSDACKGSDDIEVSANVPIQGSGSGYCHTFAFDIAKLASWGSGTVNVSVYAKYHDSSYIKGETSRTLFVINLNSDGNEFPCSVGLMPAQDDSGNGGDEPEPED